MCGSCARVALVVIAWTIFRPVVIGQTVPPKAPSVASASSAPMDLSGIWLFREQLDTFSSSEPPMQPWAVAKFKSAKPGYGPHASADSQDPIQSCLPPGMPRILLIPFPVQIVQSRNEVIMLFEYDHYVRHRLGGSVAFPHGNGAVSGFSDYRRSLPARQGANRIEFFCDGGLVEFRNTTQTMTLN